MTTTNGADIQIDKGNYTRIHNAILEKLVQYDFTSREYVCLLYLLRMTYGFNRKEVKLSNGDIGKAAGLDPANVSRAMRSLVTNKVVIRSETGPNTAPTWKFNKYFEQWTVTSRVKTATDDNVNYCQNDNSLGGDYCQNDNTTIAKMTIEVLPKQQDHYCQNDNSYISAKDSIKDKKDKEQQLPPTDPVLTQFDSAYRRVWALVPASEYEVEKMAGWAQRVTLDAWEYALMEAVDNGAVGKWRYLERILQRVEREGVPTKTNGKPTAPPPVVPVTKPEVKPWQI